MTKPSNITVRKPKFDFSDVPNHWAGGSAVFTHLANSMFTLFPEGERFFIRSVQRYADQVTDPVLKEEVKQFIAQEVQHGKAHEDHFEILRRQGYDVDGLIKFQSWFGMDVVETWMNRIFGEEMSLAATVAAEHFTASGAENGFRSGNMEHVHPTMRALVQWHAAEELEHKHVAFDVLKQVNDSYALRMGGLVIAATMLYGMAFTGAIYLLSQDKEFSLASLFENVPSVSGRLGQMGESIRRTFFDYLRPDFHPNDQDNRHFAADYFASLEKKAATA